MDALFWVLRVPPVAWDVLCEGIGISKLQFVIKNI